MFIFGILDAVTDCTQCFLILATKQIPVFLLAYLRIFGKEKNLVVSAPY